MSAPPKRRIGLVGYGALGQFLATRILAHPKLELAWVWNRSAGKLDDRVAHLALASLDGPLPAADLIVEVAHPHITRDYGARFLAQADYLCGSPTCFADAQVEQAVRSAAAVHACFVPVGALWGANDIGKMADRGNLAELTVTMAKHPGHLQLEGSLKEALDRYVGDAGDAAPRVLWRGPVRALCPLAPNNVNTMACAALAAHNLGFDRTVGCLVADKSLHAHVITIEALGPVGADGDRFQLMTRRYNPAQAGAVTGQATFASLWSSLLVAVSRLHQQTGVQFC